jgi:peroxin-7
MAVNWNLIRKDTFVSASWDTSIKLFSPERNKSVGTFTGHSQCVYNAVFSPRDPDVFTSCSGNK